MISVSPHLRGNFTHIVRLDANGHVMGVEATDPANHSTALPILVNPRQLSEVEILEKETEFADKIIRAERPTEIDPSKAHMVQDDHRRLDYLVSLKDQLPGKILEIGCSQGVISMRLARATGQHVTGIDIRPEAINDAHDLLANEYADVTNQCCFMTDKEFWATPEEEAYDTLLVLEVMEHLPCDLQDQVMSAALKRLKPEGVCLLSVPNRWPKRSYHDQRRTRWNWVAHVSFFSLESFKSFALGYFEEVVPLTFAGEENAEDGIWLHLLARKKRL